MTPKLPADALVAETGAGAKVDLLPATYMYLGRAQYNVAKAGDAEALARADRSFAALLQKYPDSKFAPQALYYRGEAAYASGRKAEAVAFYDKFASAYPKDPLLADDLYALGIAQSELNQPAKAEAAFAAFLKAFPQHRLAIEVSMRRGESLLEQSKLDDAVKVLGAAAATPNFALADHATMRQAAALFEQKKYAAAGAVYQTVPQKFPQSPYRTAAALAAARCLYMEGKTADARAAVAKITTADGDAYFEAAHWTARSLLVEKKPDDALKVIDPLLKKAGN